MKKSSRVKPIFVEYDDENLSHVLPGPDYGQRCGSNAWHETGSVEYPKFVREIKSKILKTRFLPK
jgi:hypothetical protein